MSIWLFFYVHVLIGCIFYFSPILLNKRSINLLCLWKGSMKQC